MMGVSGEFRFLLEQKEREIIGLCEQQMQTIHQQISEKDKEFVELAARFAQLEEDFKYNLALLDERDVELANYDQTCASFKTLASEREVLLKEAKESLANLQYERFKEKEKSEEMEGSYLKKINSLQKQMEHLQLTHEAQHLKISQAFEATKVELTHQLSEKQEQLNLRCEELGAQYLERLNAQTIQTQLQMEDLKVNFLLAEGYTKELEMELEKVLSKHDQINEIDLKWRMCIDGKEKLIRSISMELSQLQIEKDSLKLKYDHEVKSMNEKLKELEAEHEGQISSLRKQVEACKSKLDVSEARFSSYESLKTEQIFSYDQKIRKLEREAADKDVQLWTKIEEIEVHAQHFGQDLKKEALKWKSQHEIVNKKCATLQKELSSAIEREKILQEELLKRIDPTIKL